MLTSKSIALGEKEITSTASAAGSVYGLTDAGFIEKLRAGDPEAFDKLVTRYSSDIYALLFRLTSDGDEAADLTQESFLRAFRAIGSFRGDADLKTWLYRIAINESRNKFRWWKRRRRDKMVSLDDNIGSSEAVYAGIISEATANPEEETLRHERERILQNALRELPTMFREPIVLFDIEGLSYEQICRLLQLNLGTLKSRLARGRKELKKRLASF